MPEHSQDAVTGCTTGQSKINTKAAAQFSKCSGSGMPAGSREGMRTKARGMGYGNRKCAEKQGPGRSTLGKKQQKKK